MSAFTHFISFNSICLFSGTLSPFTLRVITFSTSMSAGGLRVERREDGIERGKRKCS